MGQGVKNLLIYLFIKGDPTVINKMKVPGNMKIDTRQNIFCRRNTCKMKRRERVNLCGGLPLAGG